MAAHISPACRLLLTTKNVFQRRNCLLYNVEQIRFVRALKRKPIRVLMPENETEMTRNQSKTVAERKSKERRAEPKDSSLPAEGEMRFWKEKTTVPKEKYKKNTVTYSGSDPEPEELRFERAFAGDKRLAKLVSVARSRRFREQQGKILLEGRRLICDALDAGANPQMVFFSMVERLKELPMDKLKRATLVKVKFEEIKLWSDVVLPQGVIAIFSLPQPSRLQFSGAAHSVPLSLICDNIRDPGNMGTMLRCAAAAGCHRVLLTKGCVDAWEPKVLRAAMGAHFRIPIYTNLDWQNVRDHLPEHVTVHVADNSCNRDTVQEIDINTTHKSAKAGDYGWVSTRRSFRTDDYSVSDSESEDDVQGVLSMLEPKLYYENWARKHTALVVGGETHGLSLESVELAEKTDGQRLFIPVAPDVDSLNSAMAASILLFEGRKQLLGDRETSVKKQKSRAEVQSS